jgi:hypothetical protein
MMPVGHRLTVAPIHKVLGQRFNSRARQFYAGKLRFNKGSSARADEHRNGSRYETVFLGDETVPKQRPGILSPIRGSVMDAASILFVVFMLGIGIAALWPGRQVP